MKSPKKRTRPSQTPVVLYERDIRKMMDNAADNMLTLVTAYLMDELDYDEDRIVDLWNGITWYAESIKDHTITLKKVKDIITENTGIKLLGSRHGRVETDTKEQGTV